MGCVASKKNEEDDDVVLLCKERKRLLKMAVERRYALADAQCKYNHSLCAVAAAIRLFVSRYSSPASPFLITFPSASASASTETTETVVSNPMFLHQRPSEPTHQTISCPFSDSAVAVETSGLDGENQGQENPEFKEEDSDYTEYEEEAESESEEKPVCEHFYDEMAPLMPSPQRDFGWDFFYPFGGVRTEVVNGLGQSCNEDLRMVREEEGIPDLEEDGERVRSEEKDMDANNGNAGDKEVGGFEAVTKGENVNENQQDQKGLNVVDASMSGRELLEALKDVEDHFIRAYDSGLEVSRMLETKMAQMQSALDQEIKGGFFS